MIFSFFVLFEGILGQNPPVQPDRWDAIVGDYEYFLAKSTFAEEDKKTDLIQFYFKVNFYVNFIENRARCLKSNFKKYISFLLFFRILALRLEFNK